MSSVVELYNISKYFGAVKALDDINLTFEEGEIVAFLGPNGAGKSTLLMIIAAQISPTLGEAKVLGFDTLRQSENVKRNVGLVGHNSFMYDELTLKENLEFYGSFFDSNIEDYDKVIEITNLRKWENVNAGNLSYGLRKRSDIARALLGHPRILVLDELFAGLDPETSETIEKHLRSLKRQTILLSSHSIERTLKLCDRGVYIRRGTIEKDVKL